jgi:heme/copper-type cytochrome/quinol oxidase subunit 2
MSIVDKDMKGIAFTLSNCLSFLVGSGMMPWVYGVQKEKDVEEGNYAMIFIMVVTVGFGLAVIPFFMYVSYTRTEDKKVNKSKDIEFVSWNIPDLSYSGMEEGEKRKSIISMKSKRSVTNNNNTNTNNTGIVVNELANAFAEPSIIETNNISQEINLENMNDKLLSDDEE